MTPLTCPRCGGTDHVLRGRRRNQPCDLCPGFGFIVPDRATLARCTTNELRIVRLNPRAPVELVNEILAEAA